MKKILLGSGHTEALAETKGRCVNFLIIHPNANNAEFHALVWLRRFGVEIWVTALGKRGAAWTKLLWATAEENWRTTEAGGISGNPPINPSAWSRAPGAGSLGSFCHQNSPKIGQINLVNTNVACRRALFVTGLVTQVITPPCMHVINKCVAYIQSTRAYFGRYHKALPNFPGSVFVLAAATSLSQISSPYLPTILVEKADPAYPVSC